MGMISSYIVIWCEKLSIVDAFSVF